MEIRLGTVVEVHDVADNTLEDRGVITDIVVLVDKNKYSVVVQSEVFCPGRTREFGYFAEDNYWQILMMDWALPFKGTDPDGKRYRLQVVRQPIADRNTEVRAAIMS